MAHIPGHHGPSNRCSLGRVTALGGDGSFVSDLDGSMGSGGSPVFDAPGGVIGVFSRVAGWFGW